MSTKLCWLAGLMVAMTTATKADIVVSGESTLFETSGSYTLDLFATGVNETSVIGAFQVSLDFSDPNLTFESVSYNDAFNLPVSAGAGDDPAVIGASDLTFTGLEVSVGQVVSLASVTIQANAPGEVAIDLREITDVFGVVSFPSAVDPNASSLQIAAIPEPGTVFALLMGSAVVYGRRKRRA